MVVPFDPPPSIPYHAQVTMFSAAGDRETYIYSRRTPKILIVAAEVGVPDEVVNDDKLSHGTRLDTCWK